MGPTALKEVECEGKGAGATTEGSKQSEGFWEEV